MGESHRADLGTGDPLSEPDNVQILLGFFRSAPPGEAACHSGGEGVGAIGLQMGKLRLQVLR